MIQQPHVFCLRAMPYRASLGRPKEIEVKGPYK
jgi:hypothetical protein